MLFSEIESEYFSILTLMLIQMFVFCSCLRSGWKR